MKKSLSIFMSITMLASSTVPPISKVSASSHQQDISKFMTQANTTDQKPDVNAQNAEGTTALHRAAQRNQRYLINDLLAHGARVDILDNAKRTVLHWAANGGDPEIIKLLIEKGVQVDIQDKDGLTALHWAIIMNKVDAVKILLESNTNVALKLNSGKTTLQLAEDSKNSEIISLIRKKASAQLLASLSRNVRSNVTLLIDNGADVNVTDQNDMSALHLALLNGFKEEAELLIKKGAKINAVAKSGLTTLHLAAMQNYKDIVKQMLSDKDFQANAIDSKQRTALHWAANGGDPEIIKLLIEKDVKVDAPDKDGLTALHWAVKMNKVAAVKELIKHGANINATDNNGKTPLDYAQEKNYTQIIQLLSPDDGTSACKTAAAAADTKDYLTDFDEDEFNKNILESTKKLQAQPKLGMALDLQGEVAVIGDIHGDFEAIKILIPKLQKWLDADRNRKVLFLGDIFDRGDTTHTLDYLLKFYLHNDGKVFILRGNHETEDAYRFCDPHSLSQPARNEPSIQKIETEIMEYFKNLPYAAIINNTTFASHAGIPSLIDYFYKFPPDTSVPGTKPSKWQDFFTSGDYSDYWIYAMLWSDFYPLEPKTFPEKLQRNARLNGGRLPYGPEDLKAFFELANQIRFETRAPLNLQHFICAHQHEKGPWSHYDLGDGHTMDLIISTPDLLQKVMVSPAYKEKPSSTIGKVLVVTDSATPKPLMDIDTRKTTPTLVKPHFKTPKKPTEKGTTRVGTTAKVKQTAQPVGEVIVCGKKEQQQM